jgi:hypothetical protein
VTRQQDSDAPGVPVEFDAEPMGPGATVGGGRYRLLDGAGGDPRIGATFWRAKDTALDRDVGITTLTGADGPRSTQAALSAGRLEHPGIARILDVLSDPRQAGSGLTGLVITEWVNGADLATLSIEATRTGRTLPAAAIARALAPLAAAVDVAHRNGRVIGVDHPHKIRIGGDGLARLAFPVASVSGVAADDVRGLGAALYLLLTGYWPLPDPPAGLAAAPAASATGMPLPAQSLRPTVSATLATLAQRCLAGAAANGVYTGAAVQQLLEQVVNAEAQTMTIAPVPPTGAGAGTTDDGWPAGPPTGLPPGVDPDRDRRRKLAFAMSALGIAVLVLVGWVGVQVANFFADDKTAAPTVVVSRPGQPSGSQSPGGQPAQGQPGSPQASPAGPIRAAAIEVFDVTGDPDNANRANRAIDGNPQSSWKTYEYNQPFPALKPGVGVLVSFAEAVTLASVQVDSPSAGSTVEVRTAPAGDAGLAGTTVLGTGTLNEGRTEIRLSQPAPSQRVLVWITGLADRNGKNVTELGELTFIRVV